MSQSLVSIQKASKSFGLRPLFTEITLVVAEGDRLALIGPNGAGKSTLLRMVAGKEDVDDGEIARRRGTRIGYVEQQSEFQENVTIGEVLREAAATAGGAEYEQAARVQRLIQALEFVDTETSVATLSGGWKNRLAIGAELAKAPDLLLLDEPTNHLDIEGILWLEEFLLKTEITFCFVSHDRYFIERISKRVVEVDRRYPAGLFSAPGSYSDFLLAREQFLDGLASTQRRLANKVRREVEWLRQGAKARTTKSKHRSDEAHAMVKELSEYDLVERSASIAFSTTFRKTKDLVVLQHVAKGFGGRSLFRDVSLTLSPGTRLGVIGPNGSGKTTFIKTLLGQLEPDTGQIIRANGLRIAFFDQERKQLDSKMTLRRALCPEGDSVVFAGRQQHVNGWANRFLFRTEQLDLRLESLSGGERARALLARLMLQKADILVFDEPTNDLDISTLEVLEESFAAFPGAIVLVTHDRYFMDRVATMVIGLGDQKETYMYSDYSQWEIMQSQGATTSTASGETSLLRPPKSSYEIQKELQALERKIEKEEKRLATMRQKLSDPAISHDHEKLAACFKEVADQELIVEALLAKWEALSNCS